MINPVYSVRDKAAGFGATFVDTSDYTASRGFAYSLQSGLMQYAASDFDLYRVGTFDTSTGTLTPELPKLIISGFDASNMFNSKE